MLKPLLLIIFLLPLLCYAQIDGFEYEYERPVQVNNTVLIKWTLVTGSTCNGTNIERSIDSIHYVVIGNIAGECGSPNFNVPYDFTDDSPEPNKRNYYRLVFNRVGNSKTLSVFVVILNDKGVLILPNPVKESATIYFNNDNHAPLDFRLFDYSGRLMLEETQIVADQLIFNSNGLPQGVYLFHLLKKNEVRSSGRLIIID